jgi:hypothetical protein
MNEARAFSLTEWDWSVPVLYMRTNDGRLLLPEAATPVKETPADPPGRGGVNISGISGSSISIGGSVAGGDIVSGGDEPAKTEE